MTRKPDGKLISFVWTPNTRSEIGHWLTRLFTYMSHMRRSCDHNPSDGYWRQTEEELIVAYRCSNYWNFISCLVVKRIQSWMFSSVEPLCLCINVKFIERPYIEKCLGQWHQDDPDGKSQGVGCRQRESDWRQIDVQSSLTLVLYTGLSRVK